RPDFLNFVETDLKSVGPGYIASCLVLARQILLDGAKKAALLEFIGHAPRRDVLAHLLNKAVRKTFVNVLRRLDVRGIREIDVWRLAELVDDAERGRHLCAIDHLTTSLIFH